MAAGYRQLQNPPGQVRYKALYDEKKKEMIEEMTAAGDTGDRIIPEAVVAEVNKALIPNAEVKKKVHCQVLIDCRNDRHATLNNAWSAWRAAHPDHIRFVERRALEKQMYNKRRAERREAIIARLENKMQAKEDKAKQEQAE